MDIEKDIGSLEKNRKKILERLTKPDVREVIIMNKEKESKDEMATYRKAPEIIPQRKYKMLAEHYSIPPYHQTLWHKYTKNLLSNYLKVAKIISNSTNPPYKLAFKAGVESL
jgi:hypothetical protein